MQFPFETTTKDGRKATVLGAMPDGRLAGFVESGVDYMTSSWASTGKHLARFLDITLPLQIKPLTTYRMRNGQLAWTSGLVRDGWIYGLTDEGTLRTWRVSSGCWGIDGDLFALFDLIEELPPGTTE